MSWYSIREYTKRAGLSSSTVRRRIRKGEIKAKKFGRGWYIQPDEGEFEPMNFSQTGENVSAFDDFTEAVYATEGNVSDVVSFSSKALHHYLLLSEKLVAEKDIRISEKDKQILEKSQQVAELESYVRLLEGEVEKMKAKERAEGWL
jgi:excisionase family DNA binding protein